MEAGKGVSSFQIQPPQPPAAPSAHPPASPLRRIALVASIAAGVQFGWALQLSLLTPYIQLLGITHTWAPFMWLCGPISGMIVQPLVGYYSDNCTSRFGRRRPFIAAGAALVAIAVFLIGFAADLGHASGDLLGKGPKPRAIAVFLVGFWILDVANNMLQGPCRAFLADLSGGNSNKMRTANAFFSFFMAVGNVLGYAAGSYTHLYKMFPFTKTKACDVYCANLKTCFFLSISLLIVLTTVALSIVKEVTPSSSTSTKAEAAHDHQNSCSNGGVPDQGCATNNSGGKFRIPVFTDLVVALKELPRPMWFLLLVTCLNWIAWFPFFLFDTDWMGKEVYGGEVGDGRLYDQGVRAGALGLMLNSILLGFTSLGIGFLARMVGGVKRLWGIVNFLLAICLASTILITKFAESSRKYGTGPDGKTMLLPPAHGVKIGALAFFTVMGIPLAVTFSIPFALASIFSSKSGAGQGLSLGVLNLAIVVPQMVVSCLSGPWDALFGGGNLPAFIVGAVSAAASGIFALTLLPSPPPDLATKVPAGGFH